MIANYRILFTVSVSHPYYADGCRDVTFYVPSDTREKLRGARTIWKVREGVITFAFETGAGNAPFISLSGSTLRILLGVINPHFFNFTDLKLPPDTVLRYRNEAATLKPEQLVETGDLLRHAITTKERPLALVLKDEGGSLLAEETAPKECSDIGWRMGGYPPGTYRVEEGSSGTVSTVYYHDAEMVRQGSFAVLEITVTDDFYQQDAKAPCFEVPFKVKSEVLEYFLVVSNYPQPQLGELALEDVTKLNGSLTRLTFTPVTLEPLPAPYDTLGGAGAVVLRFRADQAVPRSEVASRKIALKRNDEQLIGALPLPAADKTDGRMVVFISK